jgi:acetate---CoA ligase (ADP-forming)
VIGLADGAAVADGWRQLQQAVAKARPDVTLDGVLVEEMVARGVELITGARNDADWGAVPLVGFGGGQAEIARDSRLPTPGIGRAEIVSELLKLKRAALFRGFREAPPLDGYRHSAMLAVEARVDAQSCMTEEIDDPTTATFIPVRG